MKNSLIFKYSITTGLCWGIIGGIVMTLVLNLPIKVAELIQLACFLTCLVASAMTVRLAPSENRYFKLFVTSFVAFMLMFTVPHIYLAIRDSREFFWGYFFTFSVIALFSCALLTFLVTRRR